MFFGSFTPENYTKTFDGAVAANTALSRSLNVPAVHLLKEYGYPRFHEKLRDLGMTTLDRHADHYGLSLILGGSEGTLWDLANIYAGMSRTLNNFYTTGANPYQEPLYQPADFIQPEMDVTEAVKVEGQKYLGAASIWFAFEAMLELYRPDEDAAWKMYGNSRKIAWKTGTSFGYRDGWAIGLTPDHVVAVWVGNADGEGRPGLTGIKAAAPIMFDIFDLLPGSDWFMPPVREMTYAPVDRESGFLASQFSNEIDTVLIPKAGLRTPVSPFHQRIHLDASQQYRVNGDCEAVSQLVEKDWFVLPPKQAYYYKKKHPTYRDLPPMRGDCFNQLNRLQVMDMIYPEPDASLFLPTELDGTKGEVVFEVAHRNLYSQLHWHLNDQYLGTTQGRHQMSLQPAGGSHTITVTDNEGNSLKRRFKILTREGED